MKDHATAASSDQPTPNKRKTPEASETTAKPAPPAKKPKTGGGDVNTNEADEQAVDEKTKKKMAHKLYMRFHRAVHRPCLSNVMMLT